MVQLIEWMPELLFDLVRAKRKRPAEEPADEWAWVMMDHYSKGQYQKALAISDIGVSNGVDLAVFRGAMLMQLGRDDEAERTLLRAVERDKEPKSKALAKCALGELYLAGQNYDQALACFKAARGLWPERAATHRSLAEVYLGRGDNFGDALQHAFLAVEGERAGEGISPESKTMNLAEGLAVLACATAATSRNADEVEEAAEEAIGLLAGAPVSTVAHVHVYLAVAHAIMGDPGRRGQHAEAAATADPNGVWGRQARRLMVSVARSR